MKYDPSEPQRIAGSFLDRTPDSFLLMGMGLGKTATVLNHIHEHISIGLARAALVVAPLRVCNLTWPTELQKFDHTRELRMVSLRTEEGRQEFLQGSAHIYVINWESLPNLAKLIAKRKGKPPYDIAVFDESTKGKSHSSKRAAIYHKYCPRVDRQIAMTGTPAPNSEIDLWGQMRFVDGGKRLSPSFSHFQQTFFEKPAYGYKWNIKPGAAERIQARISDVTLTLKSSDWLDLPDAVVHDIDVNLPASTMKQYKEFERELVADIAGGTVTAVNAAALVTKLLQFTSGSVYDEERQVRPIHDAKLGALGDLAKKLSRPLLVAYAYQHEADRLRAAFPQAEFMSDAGTAAAQIKLMERWNRGKIKMLCAHPRSMSHGLNMQEGGSTAVWYTLTYSKEDYEQFIGRLFRRGQKNPVEVYRLMVPGSVDWAVAEALRTKSEREQGMLAALKNLEAYRRAGGVVEIEDELGDGLF